MLHSITQRTALCAVALALFLGGCYRTDVLTPEVDGTPIDFDAGSCLLRDDANTKATTDAFISDEDAFVVFGEKVSVTDEHTSVFNGVTVNHDYQKEGNVVITDSWHYTELQYWKWSSQTDRYDFVAVSPANIGTTKEVSQGNLSVSTHYNYDNPGGGSPSGGDKYDILASTYRRTGIDLVRRYDRVPLTFSHMGSAVAVTVANTSSSTNITVTSIYYKNLVVSADAKVSLDNYGQTLLRWANLIPSSAIVRKLAKEDPTVIGPGENYTGEYQIMIPQNLELYEAQLYLTYKVGNNSNTITSDPIPLSSIKRLDGTAITSWEIGYKYTYTVSMRLDGGLLVTVIPTPWDESVQGETPGILI